MASGFDDITPHLNLSEHWHRTFDEMFQDFSPDEWTLEPTNEDMPKKWRNLKDGAKVKFLCDECGNSWTSMAGIIMFWFKKINESEKKKDVKKNGENRENDEGKDGEDHKESGNGSANKKNLYSLRFKLYGQQCKRCDNDDFQTPRWYPEEVEKVLDNVHQKIGEAFYKFPSKETNKTKRRGRPQKSHDSKRCQACKEGHCSQNKKEQ